MTYCCSSKLPLAYWTSTLINISLKLLLVTILVILTQTITVRFLNTDRIISCFQLPPEQSPHAGNNLRWDFTFVHNEAVKLRCEALSCVVGNPSGTLFLWPYVVLYTSSGSLFDVVVVVNFILTELRYWSDCLLARYMICAQSPTIYSSLISWTVY